MMQAPDFSNWLDYAPFSLECSHKQKLMLEAMRHLTHWHLERCASYRKIIETLGVDPSLLETLNDIPYLPVRLFKEFDLMSIPRDEVFKIMTSSGTSGQLVSRIFLDKATASFQTKVLSRLIGDLIGKKRVPMLVIDSPSVIKDRMAFSARGAGILGFSMFGLDVTYALNDDMQLEIDRVESFLERHPEGPVLVFGFTFMVWQYLVQPLLKSGFQLPLDRAVLFHGGGWKNLGDLEVDNRRFKSSLKDVAKVARVINYYGMVEQTGSIFTECEQGHLHAPIFSDIIVRRVEDFQPAAIFEEGIIEVLSVIPTSYPGHALLTEDRGTILGEDNCPCGRLGKYFYVHGRLTHAELRGCSDTHEAPR